MATTWCERDLSSVLDDIAAYSFWGEYDDDLAMHGIFVDETPTQYSADSISYLQTIARAIQDSDGLKEGFIGRHHFISAPSAWRPHGSVHPSNLTTRSLACLESTVVTATRSNTGSS